VYEVQKRRIALYRRTHTPWTTYELTEQPALAKECEERVLDAYERGEAEELKMHFHRYRSIGVLPTRETWHKFLLIAYQAGDYHEIQSLFHTLVTFGVQPDVTAWNFLLDVLSKRGLVRKTEEVFRAALRSLKGNVNEFTMRAFFNCLMQEKRYLRAMLVFAGMQDYGYSITAEERQTLENFCVQHLGERPGGLEELKVPEEDLGAVTEAFRLDRITFGHANVLSVSDALSPAGRDAVLTWYAKRASHLTPAQAFANVLESARFAWETQFSHSLGLDPLHIPVLRGWMTPDFSLSPEVAQALDQHLSSPPHAYNLASYNNAAGLPRFLIVSKDAQNNKFIKHIVDKDGLPVPNDEAALCNAAFKNKSPLDFVRQSL
jgi:hypothetical protein